MKYAWYMLLAVMLCCTTSTSPDPTIPQTQEVIVNVPEGVEVSTTDRCDGFIQINRRAVGNNRVRVKVEWEEGRFDYVRVKFLINDGGLPRFIHIERRIDNGTAFEVDLVLPKCGVDYKVYVYIEGMSGDAIAAQCDGSVQINMRCGDECFKPPEPTEDCDGYWFWNEQRCNWVCREDRCYPQECGECQTWDPVACECTGSCACTPCEFAALDVVDTRTEDIFCLNMDGSLPYTMSANGSSIPYDAGFNQFCWQLDCEETLSWSVLMQDACEGLPVTCHQFSGSEVGECDDPICEPPNRQTLSLSSPIGPPQAECAYFGSYVPTGTGPAAFWVTKCGKGYEVTSSPWLASTCTNGKDVSHTTPCWCEVI